MRASESTASGGTHLEVRHLLDDPPQGKFGAYDTVPLDQNQAGLHGKLENLFDHSLTVAQSPPEWGLRKTLGTTVEEARLHW